MQFQSKIIGFYKILSTLKLDEIEMEGYTKDYLKYIISQNTFYLEVYAFILEKIIANNPLKLQNINLLDFGAGNGLLAFFAKYCGVNQVIVCDLRPEFITSIKKLSNSLNIDIDGYILGNEANAVAYFSTSNINPNVCIGTDVIEHVYSVDSLLASMKLINPNIVVAFSTASVYDNFIKRKQLYKLMWEDEYVGYDLKGDTEGGNIFAGQPFLQVRKQIIQQIAPQLPSQQTDALAAATRGLNKNDIEKVVIQFIENNQIPSPPKNKYNTCNPITSCFTEQMLTHKNYKNLYQSHGFNLISYNGIYSTHQKRIKKLLMMALNLLPKVFKTNYLGRVVAPFVVLYGAPVKSK